jgi:hypothetical protein
LNLKKERSSRGGQVVCLLVLARPLPHGLYASESKRQISFATLALRCFGPLYAMNQSRIIPSKGVANTQLKMHASVSATHALVNETGGT